MGLKGGDQAQPFTIKDVRSDPDLSGCALVTLSLSPASFLPFPVFEPQVASSTLFSEAPMYTHVSLASP